LAALREGIQLLLHLPWLELGQLGNLSCGERQSLLMKNFNEGRHGEETKRANVIEQQTSRS
jgi:hypothetical protein